MALLSHAISVSQVFKPRIQAALNAWVQEVENAEWDSPASGRKSYGTASIINEERVVFNIKGNSYRLVVAIQYRRGIVFSMAIKPIRSDEDRDKSLREVERLWDAREGTPASDRLEVLTTLVEAYERTRFPAQPLNRLRPSSPPGATRPGAERIDWGDRKPHQGLRGATRRPSTRPADDPAVAREVGDTRRSLDPPHPTDQSARLP